MRVASLGSGSGGNATLVEAAGTRLLLDCGLGPRVTERGLRALGVDPETLCAVVLSHEHSDHLRGLARLATRYRLPVHATQGTLRALPERPPRAEAFDAHRPLTVGGLAIEPFPVVHDAAEPCQFVVDDGRHRFGVLTDSGVVSAHMARALAACDGLLLECNHDPAMLRAGPYPRWLQDRIAGRYGHLDNGQAAALLATLDVARLQWVLAGHLSERNNDAAAVRAALGPVLGRDGGRLEVLGARGDSTWRELA